MSNVEATQAAIKEAVDDKAVDEKAVDDKTVDENLKDLCKLDWETSGEEIPKRKPTPPPAPIFAPELLAWLKATKFNDYQAVSSLQRKTHYGIRLGRHYIDDIPLFQSDGRRYIVHLTEQWKIMSRGQCDSRERFKPFPQFPVRVEGKYVVDCGVYGLVQASTGTAEQQLPEYVYPLGRLEVESPPDPDTVRDMLDDRFWREDFAELGDEFVQHFGTLERFVEHKLREPEDSGYAVVIDAVGADRAVWLVRDEVWLPCICPPPSDWEDGTPPDYLSDDEVGCEGSCYYVESSLAKERMPPVFVSEPGAAQVLASLDSWDLTNLPSPSEVEDLVKQTMVHGEVKSYWPTFYEVANRRGLVNSPHSPDWEQREKTGTSVRDGDRSNENVVASQLQVVMPLVT